MEYLVALDMLCVYIPQAWLDKRRAELNGLLMIGALFGDGLFSFIFPLMVDLMEELF